MNFVNKRIISMESLFIKKKSQVESLFFKGKKTSKVIVFDRKNIKCSHC